MLDDSKVVTLLFRLVFFVDLCLEKVYITPSPMGVDYITAQPMKRSISPLKLCKTGQITPYNGFEKS
jgi:hypothetical protein